jgi:hypothetical protein
MELRDSVFLISCNFLSELANVRKGVACSIVAYGLPTLAPIQDNHALREVIGGL